MVKRPHEAVQWQFIGEISVQPISARILVSGVFGGSGFVEISCITANSEIWLLQFLVSIEAGELNKNVNKALVMKSQLKKIG
jgi:hypothetical protein